MWIQVEDTIRDHDKIFKLSDTLGVSDAHAIGLMVCLWVWASSNAPDGDLTNFPPRAIAAAAKWDKTGAKSAGRFYDALLEARLLERLEDGRIVIRNWDKHASLIMDYIDQQREKTNARVKRYRERKKSKKTAPELSESVTRNVSQSQDCNVSVTLQNGDVTPIPYQTIPITPLTQLLYLSVRTCPGRRRRCAAFVTNLQGPFTLPVRKSGSSCASCWRSTGHPPFPQLSRRPGGKGAARPTCGRSWRRGAHPAEIWPGMVFLPGPVMTSKRMSDFPDRP